MEALCLLLKMEECWNIIISTKSTEKEENLGIESNNWSIKEPPDYDDEV